MALATATNSTADLPLSEAQPTMASSVAQNPCVPPRDNDHPVPDKTSLRPQDTKPNPLPTCGTPHHHHGPRVQTLDLYLNVHLWSARVDYHLHRVAAPPLSIDRRQTDLSTWSADAHGCDRCESTRAATAARYRCAAAVGNTSHSTSADGAGSRSENSVRDPSLADACAAEDQAQHLALPACLFLHERIGSGNVGKCYRATVDAWNGHRPEKAPGCGRRLCSGCNQQYVVKFAVEGKAAALAGEAACYEMLQAAAGVHQRSWPRYYGRYQGAGVDAIVVEYTGEALEGFYELSKDEK
jgi:hypothetical protein